MPQRKLMLLLVPERMLLRTVLLVIREKSANGCVRGLGSRTEPGDKVVKLFVQHDNRLAWLTKS